VKRDSVNVVSFVRPLAASRNGDPAGCDSIAFRHMLGAAVQLLSQRAESINTLNVFPVPDGDTGTNLLLTMRAAVRAAADSLGDDVGSVTEALAHGALMGARGNSGVILSQYLRGLARGLAGQRRIDGRVLARALDLASVTARQAVSNPVDGTLLSVASDIAMAAAAEAERSADLTSVMRRSVDEGRRSVARTRETMPLLRQAGVVDAGGMGLLTILEAMYRDYVGDDVLTGEPVTLATPTLAHLESRAFGYCTEFLVRGRPIDVDTLKVELGALGESLLVVGDSEIVRVHVHTFEPGRAIDLALKHGAVDQIKIENMQEQSERLPGPHVADDTVAACGLVVVSMGDGFADLFKSLGATVISGGKTLNPSTEDIVAAVRATSAREVVILPNSSNVAPAARQALSLCSIPAALVPTRNLAEGVAAALSFQSGRGANENVEAMGGAVADVRTGLLIEASHAAVVDGRATKPGDILGLVDDRITIIDGDCIEVGIGLLRALAVDRAEIVTIYVGEGAATTEVERLRVRIAEDFGRKQVDVVQSGQPLFRYILACE
jgi:uncharacterized protein